MGPRRPYFGLFLLHVCNCGMSMASFIQMTGKEIIGCHLQSRVTAPSFAVTLLIQCNRLVRHNNPSD